MSILYCYYTSACLAIQRLMRSSGGCRIGCSWCIRGLQVWSTVCWWPPLWLSWLWAWSWALLQASLQPACSLLTTTARSASPSACTHHMMGANNRFFGLLTSFIRAPYAKARLGFNKTKLSLKEIMSGGFSTLGWFCMHVLKTWSRPGRLQHPPPPQRQL